jgi:hypothetical protein
MEQEKWIQKVVNSINGMKQVTPSDGLFSKIQKKINFNSVSLQTVWLVAASIVILVLINFTFLTTKTSESNTISTYYLEKTLNKSNQLYQ